MSAVEPSVYVPVAVNCCVRPALTEGVGGVTAIETSVAFVTVTVAVPTTLLPRGVALIVVGPRATVETRPAASTVAAAVLEDDHATTGVTRACLVPSLKVAVAVIFCVVPSGIFLVAGVTITDVMVALSTVIVA